MQCLSKHRRAKRMPWRTKGGQVKKIFREGKITVPGECVSVVESSVTGLISQLKGILTKWRYLVAKISVNHLTSMNYLILQQSTISAEIVATMAVLQITYFGTLLPVTRCNQTIS